MNPVRLLPSGPAGAAALRGESAAAALLWPRAATLSRPALIICWSFALPEKSPENVAAVRPSLNWSSTRRRVGVLTARSRSPTALARKSALTNM